MHDSLSYTGFDGHHHIATGPLATVALALKRLSETGAAGPLLIFDDATGQSIDVDTRGSDKEVASRLASPATTTGLPDAQSTSPAAPAAVAMPSVTSSPDASASGTPALADEPRGRGRPRLGVVPREVTLLPRHWEWLATQPGGASVALRKLVEEARRVHGDKDKTRKAQERAYHFMSAMAGNLPGFEEATRALFANDRRKFNELIATWPTDVRDHACRLAFSDNEQDSLPKG